MREEEGVCSQKLAAKARAEGRPSSTSGVATGTPHDSSCSSTGKEINMARLQEKNEYPVIHSVCLSSMVGAIMNERRRYRELRPSQRHRLTTTTRRGKTKKKGQGDAK